MNVIRISTFIIIIIMYLKKSIMSVTVQTNDLEDKKWILCTIGYVIAIREYDKDHDSHAFFFILFVIESN